MTQKLKDIKCDDEFYAGATHNIFAKMLLIEKELGVVAKNLEIQATRTSAYKAVSERDVIDAVKPLETKYGVYSYPASRTIIKDEVLENTREVKGEMITVTSKFARVETVYRFVNIDKPEEFVEITSYGDGIDTGDKAMGKAMTYCDKYALMKAYKISTGEDPDATKSPVDGYKQVEQSIPKATQAQINYIRKLYTEEDLRNRSVNLGILTATQASSLIKEARNAGR